MEYFKKYLIVSTQIAVLGLSLVPAAFVYFSLKSLNNYK